MSWMQMQIAARQEGQLGGQNAAGYSQISDHITAQTPSRRGLLLLSPAPAIVGGTSAVASAVKARIWCCSGRPELSFFNACWSAGPSLGAANTELRRCRDVVGGALRYQHTCRCPISPAIEACQNINWKIRVGEAGASAERPPDENRSVPASFLAR